METHEGFQFSNEYRMPLDADVCQKAKYIMYLLIDEARFWQPFSESDAHS